VLSVVEKFSFGLQAEGLLMQERAVQEVLGFKVVEEMYPRLSGHRDDKGVDTLCLDGKPVMEIHPLEVTTEMLPDRMVTRLTLKWRRL
jgi:hypothetical protein